jgi:multidrug efflux system outer membrane protein
MKKLLYLSVLISLNSCIPKFKPPLIPNNQSFPLSYQFKDSLKDDSDNQSHTTSSLNASFKDTLPSYNEFFKDSLLVNLINIAVKNNFDVQMALQRMEYAKAEFSSAKGAMLPTVNGSAAFQQRKFGYYTMDDAGNRVTEFYPGFFIPTHLPDYYLGFVSNWEIDLWGKLKSRKKAAFLRFLESSEGKHLIVTGMVDQIASYYYELLALDKELELIRSSLSLQRNALEILKVQKEAGHATELSIKQFEALVFNSKSIEVDCQKQIQLLENAINNLLGRYPEPIKRNSNFFNLDSLNIASTGVPAALLQNRPDIRGAELNLRAAKLNVKAARAAFYPSFNILGTLGFQAFNTQFLFNFPQSVAYNILGNLTGPLVNRSAIKAHFYKANAEQLESLYRYQKTLLNAYLEVSSGLSSFKYLSDVEDLKTREAGALDTSVKISNDLFLNGKANYLEVLMAQKTALQSNIDLIRIRKERFITNIHLYKSLGGGWR